MSENPTSRPDSRVEAALRGQRASWREITSRVSTVTTRELNPEVPKRFVFFGLGSSHFAARLAAYALIRDKMRTRIPVVACSSLGIGTEVIPGKGDWAFALTHRGKPGPTLQALDLCDKAGAFTVQVSAQGVRESESARYLLSTVPLEQVEPHTQAVTGALCAITNLLLGTKVFEEWDALATIGDPALDLLQKRAEKGPSVILGEWEAEWIAREGALKVMEMAKIPVRAYSSEEFFHGPRMSVGPKDKIWHVSLPKDPRNAEIQAHHRIGVYGSSPLAFVPALVELQWLALATALNLGVDPDATP